MAKKALKQSEVTVKEAVNVLDLLLGGDAGKIKVPFKDVEIPRLSETFGVPFVVRCEALTPELYEYVQESAISVNGKDVSLNTFNLQIFSVIEGVKSLSENTAGEKSTGAPLLKNSELMKKFNAITPKELCKAIFSPGEIAHLYNTVSALSGFSDDAITEIKN